jgi:hypothetical protein
VCHTGKLVGISKAFQMMWVLVMTVHNIIHQTNNENPRFFKPNIIHLYPNFSGVYYIRTAITVSGQNPEASELTARVVFFSS